MKGKLKVKYIIAENNTDKIYHIATDNVYHFELDKVMQIAMNLQKKYRNSYVMIKLY